MVAHLTYLLWEGDKKSVSKRGSCVKESRHRARLSDYGPDGILREEADFGAEIEEEEVAWGELNGGGISS
jgi:hypothetical protein